MIKLTSDVTFAGWISANWRKILPVIRSRRKNSKEGQPPVIQILSAAFLLGLIFNAAPGAVFAETIRRSMTGGFREALILQLASLTGDALWAILGLLGIGMLLQSPSLQLPIAIAGSVYLGYLALDSWKAANAPAETSPIARGGMSAARAGVILSTTNPQNIAYWAALGSAFAAIGIADPQPADFALFFTAHAVVNSLVLLLRGHRQQAVRQCRRKLENMDLPDLCAGLFISCLRHTL